MADMITRWEIDVSIAHADKVNGSISKMDHSIKSITDSAKGMRFDEALDGVKSLEEQFKELQSSEEDCTQEMAAFGRVSARAYKDIETQATKLNYSLSEQGKAQRERIAELRREKAALTDNSDDKKRAKEIEKELSALMRDVVDASDDELSKMIAQNREARARLKLMQGEAKIYKYQQSIIKSLSTIVKDDNKSLKEKVKAVGEMAKGLLKSEELWKKIGSAAKKAGAVAGGIAKTAGKLGLGIAGGAMAVGGLAMASASSQAQKEAEARRIKGGGTLDDKMQILGDLYIKTGADSSSIVDAINRVYSVLGTGLSHDDVVKAAQAEIMFPGGAALFKQQNVGTVSASDFQRYMAKMRAVQGATGASVEQIKGSTEYISNLRQSYFQNATENELQSVYLALQGSGAFDTEEELKRAFRGFARSYASRKNQGKSLFEVAQSYDWSRTAWGATNKQQARKAMSNLDWGTVEASTQQEEYTQSAAEKDAERVRRLEETKNRIMAQILKIMEPLAAELEKALDSDTVKRIAEGLVSFLTKAVPIITDILLKLSDWLGVALEKVGKAVVTVIKSGADYSKSLGGGWSRAPGKWMADGGITSIPSICGEAGAEAVIPLTRQGRGTQILQQVEQHFTMMSGETTARSLASVIGSNSFAFESGRLGNLARRRGI